jgi:hypothetical protein
MKVRVTFCFPEPLAAELVLAALEDAIGFPPEQAVQEARIPTARIADITFLPFLILNTSKYLLFVVC